MQPIAVAVGLTVTILALTVLLAGPQFAYLAHTPASSSPSTGRRSPPTARSPC